MNEEDVDQVELNERELRRKGITFTTKQVSTRDEFVAALEDFNPDVILSDYHLPSFDALTALRIVRERRPEIPVIIVTGSVDEEAAAGTIKAGAADYVLKSRLVKLPVAVEGALERARIVREKERAEAGLQEAFRQLKKANQELNDSKVYAENIIYTMRHPLVVLDEELRVVSANQAFYEEFLVTKEESEGRSIFELGNGQWNITELRKALETVIPRDWAFKDFEVEHDFPKIGHRIMRLNGRQIRQEEESRKILLLAIEDVTESVTARRELQASEEKYHGLIQQINSVVFRFDSEGRITFLNRFGEKIFGYREEEVLGRPLVGTLVPEKNQEGESQRGISDEMLRNPERFYLREMEGRTKDGGTVWVQWSASGIRDEKGNVKEILVDGNDITGEKEYRRMLGETRSLVESSPDIVARFDGAFRLVYGNPLLLHVLGRSREQVLGKTVRETGLSGEKAGELEGILVRAGATQVNTMADIELKGREYHFQVVPEGGGQKSLKVYATDITDRKKAEDLLRRNEYELRMLVEESPDIIVRLDRGARYLYANPTYERISGLSKEQMAGRTNEDLGMPREQAARWREHVRSVCDSGQEESFEFEINGLFGTRFFWGEIVPEFEKSGLVESVMVIGRDVTDRKKAEDRIRHISFHDEVTGLFNRAYFEEELRRLDTERMLPLGIIMGDVNHLKLTNDVFGHEEGDRLLKKVAEILRRSCRDEDIIARWGGDEFTVILPKTSEGTARAVMERIALACRQSRGTPIPTSLALGVAVKNAREQNVSGTVRAAEEGMYANKLAERAKNEELAFSALREQVRKSGYDVPGHEERLEKLVDDIRSAAGLSDRQYADLQLLVRLHDMGKATLSREVLRKPGRLSPGEWRDVRKYPEASYRVANTFSDTAPVADEVFSVREQWDGKGYPRGIKGEEIPYLARLLAILDAYDAMTNARPYAGTLTRGQAIEELQRNAGRQFDPALVVAVAGAIGQKAELVNA